MIFSSIPYFIFFVAVLILMIMIRSKTTKKVVLLVTSYYFYAYWDYRFLLLLFIISAVNYLLGKKIEAGDNFTKRKWFALSIVFNLIILGFFKYYNFFISSFNTTFANFNISMPLLNIILPIGISFVTFEVISYVIDIYRGTNKSAKHFLDLAILVAFFPHLIAGPILKPAHFLPQLDNAIIIRWRNVEIGLQIFLLGLVKKLLIANRLALFVDPVFKSPYIYSWSTIWLAVIAYTFQIYCDFSGYTDMAIGSAKCLGFEIPQNFNMPYISCSITEFWRRWHISLSTWLKDYLYISLGGNRKGKLRRYVNLIVVMLLGGLWHGASWNFVVWGGLHGTALAIHKVYQGKVNNFKINSRIYKFLCWVITFVFVCIAWIFFRSSNFAISWFMIRKMCLLLDPGGTVWYPTSLLLIIPIIICCHYIRNNMKNCFWPLGSFKGLVLLFFVLLGLLLLVPQNFSPFIYFQF